MAPQNQKIEPPHGAENPSGVQLNRRAFLRTGGVSAVVLGSVPLCGVLTARATESSTASAPATPTVSQPPLPVVDARFPGRIADGVWLIPDKRIPLVPNIGIVEGSRAVLVIDCGFTPESGRDVLAAARTIAGRREIILTVTHAHPEHTFGAQAFKGQARIYYNQAQRDHLAREGEKLLTGFRPFLPPDRRHLLDHVKITLADEVYEGGHASLDLGGRTVHLQTWGVAHSPGDQVITVADQGVVFAGDLIEERMFPIVPFFPPLIAAADINVRTWEAALNEITEKAPRLIVPGHGNLGGSEIAQQVAGYLAEVRRLTVVTGPGKTGAASTQALQQLEAQVRDLHPTWERTEFIAPALQYFAQGGAGA